MDKVRSKDGTLIACELSGTGPAPGFGAWHNCRPRMLGVCPSNAGGKNSPFMPSTDVAAVKVMIPQPIPSKR
jgi:hypothetical protein